MVKQKNNNKIDKSLSNGVMGKLMITLLILCFNGYSEDYKNNTCDQCNGVNQYQAGLAETGLIPAWTNLAINKQENVDEPTFPDYSSIESENTAYFNSLGE